MNQSTHIRLARKEDLDQITKSELAIGAGVIEKKIEMGEVIVTDDGGQITGILRFSWFWDYLPFINYLWVEEGFRHEKRASRMIQKLEEITEGKNYQTILTSTQADETAQNFYRKIGFEDAGGFTMHGHPFELIMIKYINHEQNNASKRTASTRSA